MGLKTRTAKILIALPSKSRTIRFLGRVREWTLPEPYACAPVVSQNGRVTRTQVVGSSPLLAQAADVVRHWRTAWVLGIESGTRVFDIANSRA